MLIKDFLNGEKESLLGKVLKQIEKNK